MSTEKTVFEALNAVTRYSGNGFAEKPFPKNIWACSVQGPISADDPFEIVFSVQQTAGAPVERWKIVPATWKVVRDR